jgi:hypothetical protein
MTFVFPLEKVGQSQRDLQADNEVLMIITPNNRNKMNLVFMVERVIKTQVKNSSSNSTMHLK